MERTLRHVLAIDQGTTGSTALIVDSRGRVQAKANREFRQIFPKPGLVEHAPEDLWSSVLAVSREAFRQAGLRPSRIAAIGIANQRETTLLWDRKTGREIGNAVVWQDRRTAGLCEELKNGGLEPLIRARSGLPLDPYFSATKIRWLLDSSRMLRRRARAGEIAFGTVDSFLLKRLSGGALHATDTTNASRTLLMNLRSLAWDPRLGAALGVPMRMLPEILPTIGLFGHTSGTSGFPAGLPIWASAGDQQAALFGQACFKPGDAKCTFGTGSFLLALSGPKPLASRSGLIATPAWTWRGKTSYALEGSAFACGAVVQWLRDALGIIRSAPEIERLARSVPDCAGVQFVPALAGLGAPHWDPRARGTISGLTRAATSAHLARAALEGLALQNADLIRALNRDLGPPIRSLKVDGGASANGLLMQMQADFSGARCLRPRVVETTALGAAYMAGLGAGIWRSTGQIRRLWRAEREFLPAISAKQRERRLKAWERAVLMSRGRN